MLRPGMGLVLLGGKCCTVGAKRRWLQLARFGHRPNVRAGFRVEEKTLLDTAAGAGRMPRLPAWWWFELRSINHRRGWQGLGCRYVQLEMFHSADTRLVLQSEPGEPTPHRERWVVDSDATHGKNESVSSWWIVVAQYPHLATMDENTNTQQAHGVCRSLLLVCATVLSTHQLHGGGFVCECRPTSNHFEPTTFFAVHNVTVNKGALTWHRMTPPITVGVILRWGNTFIPTRFEYPYLFTMLTLSKLHKNTQRFGFDMPVSYLPILLLSAACSLFQEWTCRQFMNAILTRTFHGKTPLL